MRSTSRYSRDISVTPGRSYQRRDQGLGHFGEVDYDLGDATLTSITAYRDYKSGSGGDIDYSTVDILYRADDGDASASSRPSARSCACRARRSTTSSTGWSAAISPTRT